MENNYIITHHGIKGMKWGVRRTKAQLERAANRKADRQRKKQMRQDVKNRRLLTDEELNAKIRRLEMEKKLRTLTDEEINRGRKAVTEVLEDGGKQAAKSFVAGGIKYGVKAAMKQKFDISEAADYVAPKPKK
jgi:outer membrane receptor for ferrienterochelin and colicin